MLMLLLLFFSSLLLSSLSPLFFLLRALAFVPSVLALRVGLAALSWSLAGFEAMFWVEWVGADATGRNSLCGGFCLRAPPSNHGHHLSTFKAYRSASSPSRIDLAPRGEDEMVAYVEETESSASSTSSGRHSAVLPIVGPPRGLLAWVS